MSKKDGSRSERIFRALLRLFPFDFRWKHGREMEQVFREQQRERERKGGSMGTLKLWWETLADIARTAPREHLEMLAQDAGFALRLMRKNLGFTTVAVLTLALGIGANTAIFSVINGVLLQPFPFEEPDKLVLVWESNPKIGFPRFPASPPNYFDWKAQNQSFKDIAAYASTTRTITGGDEPERVSASLISANLISVLGVSPAMGRNFLPEEDRPGGSQTVLISHGLWMRLFGVDPDVLGKVLTINGTNRTIIGVMPSTFLFPSPATDLWIPFGLNPSQTGLRGAHYVTVLARLDREVTLAGAQTEMDLLASRLEAQYPETNKGWGVALVPLHEQVVEHSRTLLLILSGSVGLVLLIACSNIGSLLFVRSAQREKEIAVRAALGAGRIRIFRQLVTETLLLSLLGGSAGFMLAYMAIQPLLALSAGKIPRAHEIGIDVPLLGFTLSLSLLVGIFLGLIPVKFLSASGLSEALRGGGRRSSGPGGHRLHNLLVVMQVASTLVLLAGAGLLIKSFANLKDVDPGFRPQNLLTFRITLPSSKYQATPDKSAFYQPLLDRLEAMPEIYSAGAIQTLPMMGRFSRSFTIDGALSSPEGTKPEASNRVVTPGYFPTMGIPVLRGRNFTAQDRSDSPNVVIVNEAFVKEFFPDRDPLGKRLDIMNGIDGLFEIVGVVGNVRVSGLDRNAEPNMYVPFLQDTFGTMTVVVRTEAEPTNAVAGVRIQVLSLDGDLPIYAVSSMEQVVAGTLSDRRFTMFLLGLFAALALALALVGIYGVISYSVSQRTHEIGIRIALGAQRRDILKLVVGHGIVLTLMGVGVGLAGAFALTRFLESLLFGVAPTDPATFLVVAVLLTGVAMLACWIPARRATKVDPMVALRYE